MGASSNPHATSFSSTTTLARNQLGTPEGAKSYLRGVQMFSTMSNTFFQRGQNIFRGGFTPLHLPSYGSATTPEAVAQIWKYRTCQIPEQKTGMVETWKAARTDLRVKSIQTRLNK